MRCGGSSSTTSFGETIDWRVRFCLALRRRKELLNTGPRFTVISTPLPPGQTLRLPAQTTGESLPSAVARAKDGVAGPTDAAGHASENSFRAPTPLPPLLGD